MDEVAFINKRQDERMEGIEEGALSLVSRVASVEEENRQLREVQWGQEERISQDGERIRDLERLVGVIGHQIFASLTFFKPFLSPNLHTNYLFYLPYPFLFLLSFQVHTIRKQRQQLYSKALMDKELFEAYLEDEGITQPFQRFSLRLSQPYWS